MLTMLKAVLKKQLFEALMGMFSSRNGKKRRSSKGAMIGYAVLMIYAVLAVGALFWFAYLRGAAHDKK